MSIRVDGNLRDQANLLTTGEETIARQMLKDSTAGPSASGQMRLSYFTARRTEVSTQCRVVTGGTAAAATPTLCRVGLYEIAANGDGTLVASVANDITLFAAANTAYTRSWSASFTKVAGKRYAWGPLIVTGAALPSFMGCVAVNGGGEQQIAPKISGFIAGLADLPSSFLAATDAGSSGHSIYGVILP